ncbi:MAG: hypothetical protein SFU85_04370 [Candidatus Methylacidiphilales bacterium]|nr:hypothetical protein [Candidatus Methylacidiphilales bacterium]
MPSLTPEQQDAIDRALFAGHKIEAIKIYRDHVHCDLKDAKDTMDQRERELRLSQPSRFEPAKAGCLGLLFLSGITSCSLVWLLT